MNALTGTAGRRAAELRAELIWDLIVYGAAIVAGLLIVCFALLALLALAGVIADLFKDERAHTRLANIRAEFAQAASKGRP